MANAIAAENCFFDCDDLNAVEFPNIDKSIVMSLLEDSSLVQMEDGDDEMLRIVIQSLEREINKSNEYSEDCRFSDDEQLESCSTSPDHHRLDFDWIDTEMDYSSPGDEMTSYFIGNYTDEIGVLGDYSEFCYEMPMEEDEYCSLWQ
ncbi:hypothetical protein PHJA_002719500 [Phtheirospermum japonicum]|uniref:Uncharacterized protein n=1 Tax=Phtheirospermum japonicum TaxID=374723 RepID=A0A830DCH6_9LAMI|nr:hypothetical protein PHJA_002719500 [Phtheirospermum japonicum]